MSVLETVEQTTERSGKIEYPVTITRRVGLHAHAREGSDPVLADEVTLVDAGKRGVSRCITLHSEASAQERAAGRKKIQAVITRIMTEQGIW